MLKVAEEAFFLGNFAASPPRCSSRSSFSHSHQLCGRESWWAITERRVRAVGTDKLLVSDSIKQCLQYE